MSIGIELNVLSTVLSGIMLMIALSAATSLIISICKTVKSCKTKTKISVVITSIISILCFALSITFFFICKILVIVSNEQFRLFVIPYAGIVFYAFGQITMLFVFTIRIDFTFRNTTLSYSKCFIKTLYCLCISIMIFFLCIALVLVMEVWTLVYIFGTLWSILYFSLTITLMVLYIRKMETVMLYKTNMREQSETCTNDTVVVKETNDTSVVKEMIDNEFFYVIIKHGLLIPIAICSSFLCQIIGIYIALAIDHDEWHPIGLVWYCLDCTISTICVYLLFAFEKNHKIYDKLCGPLHHLCARRKLVKIEQNHSNDTIHTKSDNV